MPASFHEDADRLRRRVLRMEMACMGGGVVGWVLLLMLCCESWWMLHCIFVV